MKTVIYTVSTGEGYQNGVFALINSLRDFGITCSIVVGTDRMLDELNGVAGVSQFILDTDWNGTNLKAFTILNNPAERFIYIDADIVLTDEHFIPEVEILLDRGKFVLPVDGLVSEHEFRRQYWQSIYPAKGPIAHVWYYNAGFFAGCMADHQWLLEEWIELNKKHLDLKAFLFANRRLPMADQDTLNAIVQTLPLEMIAGLQMPDWRSISTATHPFFHIGNFRPHAFLHCTGKEKPWVWKGLPGRAPHAYDSYWYTYTFIKDRPVKTRYHLSFWQKQWLTRTLLSRIAIKLKKIFSPLVN